MPEQQRIARRRMPGIAAAKRFARAKDRDGPEGVRLRLELSREFADVVQGEEKDPEVAKRVGRPAEPLAHARERTRSQVREFTADRRNVETMHPERM